MSEKIAKGGTFGNTPLYAAVKSQRNTTMGYVWSHRNTRVPTEAWCAFRPALETLLANVRETYATRRCP